MPPAPISDGRRPPIAKRLFVGATILIAAGCFCVLLSLSNPLRSIKKKEPHAEISEALQYTYMPPPKHGAIYRGPAPLPGRAQDKVMDSDGMWAAPPERTSLASSASIQRQSKRYASMRKKQHLQPGQRQPMQLQPAYNLHGQSPQNYYEKKGPVASSKKGHTQPTRKPGKQHGAKYTDVQFVAFELSTRPRRNEEHGEQYEGKPGSNKHHFAEDIHERVSVMHQAIEQAYDGAKVDHRKTTLKVMMAPEFMFRPINGAYHYGDVFGQRTTSEPGLISQLRSVVRDKKFADWVFVFGTVVVDQDLGRLHSKDANGGKAGGKGARGCGDASIGDDDDVECSDPHREYLAEGVSFVQKGGFGDNLREGVLRSVLVVKSMMSSLDFNEYFGEKRLNPDGLGLDASHTVIHLADGDGTKSKKTSKAKILNLDGHEHDAHGHGSKGAGADKADKANKYSTPNDVVQQWLQESPRPAGLPPIRVARAGVFDIDGVRIAVEICVDHDGRVHHLLSEGVADVDVQLVPSSGMGAQYGSLVVRKGGLLFNVDGLAVPVPYNFADPRATVFPDYHYPLPPPRRQVPPPVQARKRRLSPYGGAAGLVHSVGGGGRNKREAARAAEERAAAVKAMGGYGAQADLQSSDTHGYAFGAHSEVWRVPESQEDRKEIRLRELHFPVEMAPNHTPGDNDAKLMKQHCYWINPISRIDLYGKGDQWKEEMVGLYVVDGVHQPEHLNLDKPRVRIYPVLSLPPKDTGKASSKTMASEATTEATQQHSGGWMWPVSPVH